MKTSTQQLKQIIKEEIQKMLKEGVGGETDPIGGTVPAHGEAVPKRVTGRQPWLQADKLVHGWNLIAELDKIAKRLNYPEILAEIDKYERGIGQYKK
jgi:hypothetical protein